MAKFTYFLLLVYITLVLSSFVLATKKKPPPPIETIKIKASSLGKPHFSKSGNVCVSYKSVLKSPSNTTALLYKARKPKGKGKPLGKLTFPNDGAIHKQSFPKQSPGLYVIQYKFSGVLATVLIRDKPKVWCKNLCPP